MPRIFARVGLAAGVVLGAAVLTTPVAHADNCSSLQDCFYMTVDAAQVVAGVTVLVAALALFLPALLRTARTPAEAEKIASSEGSDGAGRPPDGVRTDGGGPQLSGSGETHPHPLPTAHGPSAASQETVTPSATSSPYSAQVSGHGAAQSGIMQPQAPAPAQQPASAYPPGAMPAHPGAAAASGSAPDLPNLPDTPDVPESPEAFESLLAAQLGTRAAAATDEAEEVEAAEAKSRKAREYTPDALMQMRALDVSSARVEDVIRRSAAAAGPQPGTTQYVALEDELLVTVDAITGTVVSVTSSSFL